MAQAPPAPCQLSPTRPSTVTATRRRRACYTQTPGHPLEGQAQEHRLCGPGPGVVQVPLKQTPASGPSPCGVPLHLILGSVYSTKAVFWKLRCPGKSMLQWTSTLKGDQGSGEARQ